MNKPVNDNTHPENLKWWGFHPVTGEMMLDVRRREKGNVDVLSDLTGLLTGDRR